MPRSSIDAKSALRNLADAEELIDWCDRMLAGGQLMNNERLVELHQHVSVDFKDLRAKMVKVREEYVRDLKRRLPELAK